MQHPFAGVFSLASGSLIMFRSLASGRCAAYLGLIKTSAACLPAASAPSQLFPSRMLSATYSTVSGSSYSLQALSTPQQLWQTVSCRTCSRSTSIRSFSLQHSPMKPLHISSPRSKGSARPLLPLQAAGGGGAGGSGGSKKGYSSGDGSSSSGGSGGLWESYNRLLGQYPLLVKAVTTALLSAFGNLICQFAVEGKSELDWKRFNTFTALGLVWVAPCLHFWFGTLNRLVTSPGNAGALMRMGLDQLGFAPLFISSMIAILAGLDGKSMDQCVSVVKRDLPDAIKANWALWVPAQFINFRFVAPTYQVLFANMVALVWNVYFSFATRPKAA